MVVDSHQHFWQFDARRHAWISESMQVLRHDYLPGQLQPLLQENSVDATVAVQADMSESETDFLLQCAEENDFIKGVVGWLDLASPQLKSRLEHYSQYGKLKGLRHIVQDEPDDSFMLREDFQRGIGWLEQYGLRYDILIYPRQLQAAIELARRFPRQLFVVDHLAKPEISKGVQPYWENSMMELGRHENVYCKLSGMVTETENFQWAEGEFHPFMDVVLNAFGPARVMFGSDWPVCLLGGDYRQVKEIVCSYLSSTEKNQVMGHTAQKFYML